MAAELSDQEAGMGLMLRVGFPTCSKNWRARRVFRAGLDPLLALISTDLDAVVAGGDP